MACKGRAAQCGTIAPISRVRTAYALAPASIFFRYGVLRSARPRACRKYSKGAHNVVAVGARLHPLHTFPPASPLAHAQNTRPRPAPDRCQRCRCCGYSYSPSAGLPPILLLSQRRWHPPLSPPPTGPAPGWQAHRPAVRALWMGLAGRSSSTWSITPSFVSMLVGHQLLRLRSGRRLDGHSGRPQQGLPPQPPPSRLQGAR